ncbi:glycosyltransferase family 2 protein [Lutispora sp.]|nr:glycosyltransferase family 2 protein [Lutispora sp.]MEA4960406.1 glycosyltransferase family 2 protein [Lutispora sp.]
MLKDTLHFVFVVLQVLAVVYGLYYFSTSIYGIVEKFNRKPTRNYLPLKRFAVFIPAHNEERVIGNIVENLKQLNYPADGYDVFVIADNCTDDTAHIAAAGGANVLVRTNNEKRGKGFALQWAFKEILYRKDSDYDATVIFDADNLVSKNFLKEMNNKLCEGHKVLQGYIDSKNPEDSWITCSYSMAFWSANRLFQCAREYLGLSCQIGGTGFCVDVDVLKKIGWEATCLVEDLEFTMKLMLNGIRVGWAHDAVVYDEKPLTMAQSWKQRRRWMQGFADVCSRYFMKLLVKSVKDRSFALLDCALYTLQPYMIIMGGLMLLVPFVNAYVFDNEMFIFTASVFPNFFKAFGMIQFLLIPAGLLIDKKFSYKLFLYYPTYVLYCLTWIPISIQGVIMKNNKEWSHTLHTRTLSIHELE